VILYPITLALHAIVAVLGMGLVGAIPIVARSGRTTDDRSWPVADAKVRLLDALFRATRWSLVAMGVTGILMDFEVGGAFHSSTWFRAAGVLFVLLGFSHARARAALRGGLAAGGASDAFLGRVERWGWAMCGLLALIVVDMEIKPFS
jgi:hypothetical protein